MLLLKKGGALRSLAVAIQELYLKHAGSSVDLTVETTPLGPAVATLLDNEIHKLVEDLVIRRGKGEQVLSAAMLLAQETGGMKMTDLLGAELYPWKDLTAWFWLRGRFTVGYRIGFTGLFGLKVLQSTNA